MAVRRDPDHSNSHKENVSLRGLACSFRGPVNHRHGGEHGGEWAEVLLELRHLSLAGNRKSTDNHTRREA